MDHPWVLSLVPQIKSDLEALGLKVNPPRPSDLYSNVTALLKLPDIVLASDPSVFGTDPGIIISWWNGDVWTKRDGLAGLDPRSTSTSCRPS